MKIRMILIRPFSEEGEDEGSEVSYSNNCFGRKIRWGAEVGVAMETNTVSRVFQI